MVCGVPSLSVGIFSLRHPPLPFCFPLLAHELGSAGRIKSSGKTQAHLSGAPSAYGGFHPTACTCRDCFIGKEKLKEERKAARAEGKKVRRSGCESGGRSDSDSVVFVLFCFDCSPHHPPFLQLPVMVLCFPQQTRPKRGRANGGGGQGGAAGSSSFATVGETLMPLESGVDVARLARTVEATRVAHSHDLKYG